MSLSKKGRRIACAVMAAAVLASSALTVSSAFKSAKAVDTNNDDWLHAEGSRLYDKNGNEVWLTGANWFGFNCTENCAHGLYATDVDEFLSTVADHGINLIRLPISTELLVSWQEGKPLASKSVNAANDEYTKINPDFCESDGKTLKNSMEIFDVIMGKMKKYGLKVMIDVHSPASHNSGHNYNLWYYSSDASDGDTMAIGEYSKEPITWDMWKDSITWLADKYGNDDTIIGYDLKNEPHGKRGYSGTSCPKDIAKWDDSTDLNNWAYSATECANSVLKVNPNALIFIEGVEQYPKTEKGYTYDTADIWGASGDASPWYGAWWGGNLRGVKDYPITPDSGTSQIVYSPHDYGPSVYNQTWFAKDFTTQTLLDDYWYDTWAYINDQNIAPLLIGEWGGHMDGAENQKWMTLLRDYMIDNHINHTFWCLNPNSGDTGGLLGYDFKTWDDEKYSLLEPALWQTAKTGKFISLDHEQALGVNGTGISVSEYYENYAKSEGSNLAAVDGGSSVEPATKDPSATTETPTETVKKDILGDVNSDDKINVSDVVCLTRWILKSYDKKDDKIIFTKERADMDEDGKVNVIDLAILKNKVLN